MRRIEVVLIVIAAAGCETPGDATFGLSSESPITGNGNERPLTIKDGGITNPMLANPWIDVVAGAGLADIGKIALGESRRLDLKFGTTAGTVARGEDLGEVQKELAGLPGRFIQNGILPQAASFNITGSGIVGGRIGIGTTAMPAANLEIQDAVNPMIRLTTEKQRAGAIQSWTLDQFSAAVNLFPVDDPEGRGIAFNTGGALANKDARMSILANGNIGIGTTAPATILDVQRDQDGDVGIRLLNNSNGAAALSRLDLGAGQNGGTSKLTLAKFAAGNVSKSWNVYGNPLAFTDMSILIDNAAPGRGNGLLLGTSGGPNGGSPILFGTDASERMRITGAGNIGIGTASPVRRLDITFRANDAVRGLIMQDENGAQGVLVPTGLGAANKSWAHVGYDFYAASPSQLMYSGGYNTPSGIGFGSGTINFWYATPDMGSKPLTPVVMMTMNSQGLGIATTNPATALDVNGTITYTALSQRSSRSLKTNIRPLSAEDALASLERLTPSRFAYKAAPDEEKLGFIVEDVPDLVASKDRKGLDPMEFAALLTKVVQAQQREIATMRKEMAQMKAALAGGRR